MNKNQGFTLIELLVVVLIIGILAAVALPQYRRAVLKSRAAEGVSLLHSIAKAEQVYFLANEQYTKDLEALDLTLPKFHCGSTYCQFSSAGNDFLWEITFYDEWTRYKLYCAAFPNTEAEKICQSMGTYTHTGDWVYYMMEESN